MSYVQDVFEQVKRRDPDQPEFHQAVWEVLATLEPVIDRNPHFREAALLELVSRLARGERPRGCIAGLQDQELADLPAPTATDCLVAGPEGGFEADEIAALTAAGAVPVRLGPRVLRTETAALAALAAMQTLWGDF